MGRFALRALVLAVLLFGGFASALLAARPGFGLSATTTPSTTTAGTTATTVTTVPTTPTTATTTTATTSTTSTTTATTTATTQPTTTSTAPSVLAVSGHGWGHGLGMGQWGAYGYAKHGWTYDQILAHYYAGTTLGPAPATSVRVLLAAGRRVKLASTAPWNVTDGTGTSVQLDPGKVTLVPALTVAGRQLTSPLTFRSARPLVVAERPYRGRVTVSSDGKQLEVIDVVGLQPYLKGVVPSEMPSSWPGEALKAQAVAARSYALANRAHGRSFDVYADTRSQVYGGVDAEAAAASAAVDATKGQVVLYNGKVADTLFSSSSGGRTASAAETTGTLVPYLVSVPDPYDTVSPYHNWGPVLFDAAKVQKLLKLSAAIADLQPSYGPSGRVVTLSVLAADESEAELTGSQVRSALGLRSTWFTPTILRLLAPAKAVTYGGAGSVTGFARGSAQALALESRPFAGKWAPVGQLTLDANGAFAVVVKPQVTTQYRLAWGGVRAGLARVAVAPRIDLQSTVAGGLLGAIHPALTGAPVELQLQQPDLTWATVSSTLTDEGAWSFGGSLQPGAYRIRCVPGNGLVAGVSTTFTIS